MIWRVTNQAANQLLTCAARVVLTTAVLATLAELTLLAATAGAKAGG